jgi:alpha-tubulin suppressor-like RCC1 family protein
MGLTFRCALLAGGHVACAGSNRAGELGLDPAVVERREALEPVPGIGRAARLAVGGSHACALQDDGVIVCWGQNAVGAVGRPIAPHAPGTSVAEFVPRPVAGVERAIAIAAGTHHSCAAIDDGTVRCWGSGSYGQLGRGTVTPASGDSGPVAGIDDAIDVDADGNSTCVLRAGGTVWCFGRHTEGQLGIAEADVEQCVNVVPHPCATSPRRVAGVERARELRFGGTNGCARTEIGGRCWGLLAGTVRTLDLPSDVIDVAAGTEHVCVRQADESVRCIGRGTEGQLGDGAMTDALDRVETAGS